MKDTVGTIVDRFLADYVIKLGLRQYERLLVKAKQYGYELMSLSTFYNEFIVGHSFRRDSRIFLNRHDIDVDLKTARRMFYIEKKIGVTSTFYFRLSTLNVGLMREINDYGSEVGYHFEELADFAEKHKVKHKEELEPWFDELSELFLQNLSKIESSVGFKIKSVASHGDFVNRALGYTNNKIIDEMVKKRARIDFEAYELVPYFDRYLSDAPYPVFWRGGSPFTAIEKGIGVICLLTHPVHWGRNAWVTTVSNFRRITRGFAWKYL